jgi:hypothetical protein
MKHSIIFLTSLLVTNASIISANSNEVNAAPTKTNLRIAAVASITTQAFLTFLPFVLVHKTFPKVAGKICEQQPCIHNITIPFVIGALTGLIWPVTHIKMASGIMATAYATYKGGELGDLPEGLVRSEIQEAADLVIHRASIAYAMISATAAGRIAAIGISKAGNAAERGTLNMLEKISASHRTNQNN